MSVYSGGAGQLQSAANAPRPQSEAERLNNRLGEIVGRIHYLRGRVGTIADHIVGLNPVPTPGSQAGLEAVSANTQHFVVDIEKALDALSNEVSRLDNQGS